MVTFDATGGKVSAANKSVTYQAEYGALPTATRTGYIFTGWYTAASGGKQITDKTIVETPSDHTLYAQWKEDIHSYKVNHFQMNANGSGYTLAETQTLSGRTGQSVGQSKHIPALQVRLRLIRLLQRMMLHISIIIIPEISISLRYPREPVSAVYPILLLQHEMHLSK